MGISTLRLILIDERNHIVQAVMIKSIVLQYALVVISNRFLAILSIDGYDFDSHDGCAVR